MRKKTVEIKHLVFIHVYARRCKSGSIDVSFVDLCGQNDLDPPELEFGSPEVRPISGPDDPRYFDLKYFLAPLEGQNGVQARLLPGGGH
jgi:hypothetical protein